MGFSGTSKTVSILQDSTLTSTSQRISGEWCNTRLVLDRGIGNQDGFFHFGGRCFSETARNLSLSTASPIILTAELRKRDGTWQEDSINLDQIIANIDGKLCFADQSVTASCKPGSSFSRGSVPAADSLGENCMDFVRVVREKREALVQVSRSCCEKVYVELHVPEEIYSVSRVIFRTTSHDQGFSNDAHKYGGSYDHSCTWFVAAVITPGGHDRVPRRVLQYNVHASVQFRKHEIIWQADSEDASIREWVGSIRPGDAVQIIPKAQYAAWINYVQDAEIEIHGNEGPLHLLVTGVPKPVMEAGPANALGRPFYRPLNKSAGEFRLILLNPGTSEEPIHCTLLSTLLSEPRTITYEALSYCWGDPRHRCEILMAVSGMESPSQYTLPITSALHLAMKSLRPQTGPARALWIDVLCINQADPDEKSRHLSLMREIYHQAQRVIVWLGGSSEIARNSIQTIQTISDRYERLGRSNVVKDDLARLHHPLMENLGVNFFVDEWPLFEAPWFRRTWVVQEIFNAKEAIVCCGEDTLTWEMVLRVNQCIRLSDLKMNSSYKALMPPIYEEFFASRVTTDNMQSTEFEILEVLIKGLDLDATDPRDKIFAMLQFGRETRDLNQLPHDLILSYHKSTSDVFSTFTKWWIMEHRSLRILSAIQALEGRTWLDNFVERKATSLTTERPSWSWWYRGHSNWAVGILGLSANPPFRAAAGTTPDVDLIKNSKESLNILPLTGIRVGMIDELMPYPYFQPSPNHEDLHRAYVRLFDPLNLTGKWINQLGSKHDQTYITADRPELMAGHFDAHSSFSRRTQAVECHGNCFFRTREGSIGLCPFSAKPGDVLAILHGGPVPYILRKHSGATCDGQERNNMYEFIGECFLDGYMQGQGIEKQQKNGISIEVFLMV